MLCAIGPFVGPCVIGSCVLCEWTFSLCVCVDNVLCAIGPCVGPHVIGSCVLCEWTMCCVRLDHVLGVSGSCVVCDWTMCSV